MEHFNPPKPSEADWAAAKSEQDHYGQLVKQYEHLRVRHRKEGLMARIAVVICLTTLGSFGWNVHITNQAHEEALRAEQEGMNYSYHHTGNPTHFSAEYNGLMKQLEMMNRIEAAQRIR